ncbi:MAG: hypothetical protein E7052_03140 [Lentisphaerae bacterium]|nr:hypothetical protein [Lentisphaerota bacterium]
MIYFFADDHFGKHCGKNIFGSLPQMLQNQITFYENQFDILENSNWPDDCELLILNMIGNTCNQNHPGPAAEIRLKNYLMQGRNMLLLHGSSAAFWQWDWWRQLPGFRWVRPGDPDNVPNSVHPVKPYNVRICKVRHPLICDLQAMELPADEIYTELEQVAPAMILMDTFISEGVYAQCWETITPWGGKLLNFLPGHCPEVTTSPALINNITAMINYLCKQA